MINDSALLKFEIIDEWEKEIEGVTIAYQIKPPSDYDISTWHSAICWQRGVPSPSALAKFAELPDRAQVELRLENAAAEIAKGAVEMKLTSSLVHNLLYKEFSKSQNTRYKSLENPLNRAAKSTIIYQDFLFEIQLILEKSEQLTNRSKKIIDYSTSLNERIALLTDRSKKLCKF